MSEIHREAPQTKIKSVNKCVCVPASKPAKERQVHMAKEAKSQELKTRPSQQDPSVAQTLAMSSEMSHRKWPMRDVAGSSIQFSPRNATMSGGTSHILSEYNSFTCVFSF